MSELILTYLLIGTTFFAVSVLIMIFLFGWANRDTGKNILGLILLLATSVSLPFLSYSLTQKTAGLTAVARQAPQITNLEIISIDNQSVLVNLTLSKPGTVYLKYQDTTVNYLLPILPTSTYEPRTVHSFIINPLSSAGGTATIVLNNQELLYRGQPLKIIP